MKNFRIYKKIVYYPVMLILGISLFFACSDREDIIIDNNDLITIDADIQYRNSRIVNNNFETNDEIGIYVVPYVNGNSSPGEISTSTYAQNKKHIFNGQSWILSTGGKIAWPDESTKVDIYSYYPYSETLDYDNLTSYSFAVKSDQRTKELFQASDFLWAKTENISPTKSPVGLTFQHKLSKIKVNLKAEIDLPESVLADATVRILNVKNEGSINLENGEVAELSNSIVTVSPLRTVTTSGYESTTEGIIFPQMLAFNTPFIQIELNHDNTRYNYIAGETFIFEQGKEYAFNITITRSGISVVVNTIAEWEITNPIEGEIGRPVSKVLDLSTIDWNTSKVYKVYNKGIQVAEVTREYLFKNNVLDFQAIVVYPLNSEGQVDLTKGFVAQVMNRDRNSTTNIYEPNVSNIHGGNVSWGSTTIDTYNPGKISVITKVEISKDGVKAAADNAIITLTVQPDLLQDIDGNNYSIVKIGTQYWMAENLKVEHYNDGTPLTYYYYNDNVVNKDIFGGLYSWATAADSRIAPDNWKLPVNDDFVALYQYLTPNAARKLKANVLWSSLGTNNDDVTGFSGLPGGRRTNTGTYNEIYEYGQWWSSTLSGTTNAMRIYFAAGSSAITNGTLGINYTQSVRLLRK